MRILLPTLLVSLFFASSAAEAQAWDPDKFRAETRAFDAQQVALGEDVSEKVDKARFAITRSGCGCGTKVGACSASAVLLPEGNRSVLRITLEARLKKDQCASTGVYITTQWDIDNKTPVLEEPTVIREEIYEEYVDHDLLNNREPILLPGAETSCELCEAPGDVFCPIAEELRTTIAEKDAFYAQFEPDMKSALQWAETNRNALPDGAADLMLMAWKTNIESASATKAQLANAADLIERSYGTWCQ